VTGVTTSQAARPEAGTYQLLTMKKNTGGEELYKINTKTGQVWLYSEYAIVTSDDIGAKGTVKDGLDKLIAEANSQKKNVYTLPFWDLTAETRPNRFTIH